MLHENKMSKEKAERPSFGTRPDTKSPHFDFKKELDQLPFELNIGEDPLTHEQQVCLIDLIYDHTEVFSLFDRDLAFCNALKHNILTTMDKCIYHTIKYLSSFRLNFGIVWTTGSSKASSIHLKACMHPRWLLFAKRPVKFACV